MRKLFCILVLFICCYGSAHCATFDFSATGDAIANETLENFVKSNIEGFKGNVVSYYHDIDGDNIPEIIGVVKSNLFYNLEGYKLIVLKKEADDWFLTENEIYFDNTKNFNINKNIAEYYKSSIYNFGKTKKHQSKISNKISKKTTCSSIAKKSKNTERLMLVSEGTSGVEIDLSEITPEVQKAVIIDYKELSKRTKHYLEIK